MPWKMLSDTFLEQLTLRIGTKYCICWITKCSKSLSKSKSCLPRIDPRVFPMKSVLTGTKYLDQDPLFSCQSSRVIQHIWCQTEALRSQWGRGKNTPEANVKEPFHWLFDTPVALPVSCTNTHTFSLTLCCQVPLYIASDLPRVAAAVVLVKQPVFRSHIVTVECEFWAEARVGERGGTADTESELDPFSWHVLMFYVFTLVHKYQPVAASHINT